MLCVMLCATRSLRSPGSLDDLYDLHGLADDLDQTGGYVCPERLRIMLR